MDRTRRKSASVVAESLDTAQCDDVGSRVPSRGDDASSRREEAASDQPKSREAGPTGQERPRAWELIAAQPVSLAGLDEKQCNEVVVTGVVDDRGVEHVVSRFGDAVWDLSTEFKARNKTDSKMKIGWPDDIPQSLVHDAKRTVYCAMRQGREGQLLSGNTLCGLGREGLWALRHFAGLNLTDFSKIKPLHVTDYISTLGLSILPGSIRQRISIIDFAWSFSKELLHPLPEHPFAGVTLYEATGGGNELDRPSGRTGKTPVIPRSIQAKLWARCEQTLADADEVFGRRDRGEISATGPHVLRIRDAVLYLLQICSGMRNSESTGVTNGCWRSEEVALRTGRKVTFHWVRTREVKTTGGKAVDFLVPPEAFAALELLQRYAEPLQSRLAEEARWLEKMLEADPSPDGLLSGGMRVADAVQRLNYVREIADHMLLGVSKAPSDHLGNGTRVDVCSSEICVSAMNRLIHAVGASWRINNHQCRRTFAYNVANSKLGRFGVVFVKWQFKHASMAWSQLYAANPRQGQALYDEFESSLVEAKAEVIAAWHDADARLGGGAGKRLMETRSNAAKDLKELLTSTAEAIDLRSTGHVWCLSGTRGCHGQGVYDPTLCGPCSQSVIDGSHTARWQMIHLDNLRLGAISDCGPAAEAKAKRAIATSEGVLLSLGVSPPTREQAKAYADGRWVC